MSTVMSTQFFVRIISFIYTGNGKMLWRGHNNTALREYRVRRLSLHFVRKVWVGVNRASHTHGPAEGPRTDPCSNRSVPCYQVTIRAFTAVSDPIMTYGSLTHYKIFPPRLYL